MPGVDVRTNASVGQTVTMALHGHISALWRFAISLQGRSQRMNAPAP
jgi:hypothetical protein